MTKSDRSPSDTDSNDASAATAKPATKNVKAEVKAAEPKLVVAAKQPLVMTAEERAWEIRRTRIRRILVQFLIAVGIPTLLATIYYTVWAADEYESIASVLVQSPANSGDSLGAGNFVSNNIPDIDMFKTAAQSRQTMAELIERYGWREHYTGGGNMFSGLAKDAGSEASYSYFRSHVALKGKKGAALRVSVRAFAPDAAQKLNVAMIEIAQKRINEALLSPIRSQLSEAKKSLGVATRDLDALISKQPPQTDPSAESAELLSARQNVTELRTIAQKLERRRDGQARYVSILSPPSAPDEARFPKRLWGIATVFVISLALMGILGLLLGTIREHAKL